MMVQYKENLSSNDGARTKREFKTMLCFLCLYKFTLAKRIIMASYGHITQRSNAIQFRAFQEEHECIMVFSQKKAVNSAKIVCI